MFIDILNNLILKKGFTRAKVTSDLKLGKNQIKYWEKNGNLPNGETLISMSEYFGVSTDYLLSNTSSNFSQEYKSQYILLVSKDEYTDEMWEEVKRFAEQLKQQKKEK